MDEGVFETRLVQFSGRTVPILMQGLNGPCALVAICNVLLLRGDISLSQETGEVTLKALMILIKKWLSDPNRKTGGFFLKKRPQDILKVLESFANFVTLDVGFLNIHDFEFTLEMAVFKFLSIELVHGWLLDPEDKATCQAVGNSSYNNLQDRLTVLRQNIPTSAEMREISISETDGGSLSKKQEEECISQFLQHQITYKGLFSLCDHLQEQELYVLYWNNHFSTIVKYNKEVYMLVTDIAFKNQPNHVWEKLRDVTGDLEFYTADFTIAEEIQSRDH